MCGIAGIYLRDPSVRVNLDNVLDSLLLSIESRGTDATGFVAISDDGVAEWQKASCDATAFCKYRRLVPHGTRVLLGHTRFATQGLPAFIENNHPIRRGPYFIVHNGHVNNDADLFKKAERNRFGEVDSEAIAARLASLEDLSSLATVMEEIKGYAAVAAVDERDSARLVVARGEGSPLYVYNGRAVVMFASTREAIVKAHQHHIGTLAPNRLDWVSEGTQLEWKGESEFIESKFEVPERKLFTSAWKGGSYSTTEAQKSLPAKTGTSWDEDDLFDLDKDYFNCDNCNIDVPYVECEYRYWTPERLTFIFCDDCAEMWDERENAGEGLFATDYTGQEVIDGEFEDEDDSAIEDVTPTKFMDEYDQANSSILKTLGGFLGI